MWKGCFCVQLSLTLCSVCTQIVALPPSPPWLLQGLELSLTQQLGSRDSKAIQERSSVWDSSSASSFPPAHLRAMRVLGCRAAIRPGSPAEVWILVIAWWTPQFCWRVQLCAVGSCWLDRLPFVQYTLISVLLAAVCTNVRNNCF